MLAGQAGLEQAIREISLPNINRGGIPGREIGFRRSGPGLTLHARVRAPVSQAAAVARSARSPRAASLDLPRPRAFHGLTEAYPAFAK
jgi:hypothetical protein